jgi:predicted lipoprotein with Yx(FWY)xxD motif
MQRFLLTIGALAAAALLAAGTGALAAPSSGARVATATTSLGKILVDARGHSLYLFEKDKNGKSACAGACAANWPPLITSGKPVAGGGVKASLLGTTKRADGRMQVTYNHHPLYTFVMDTKKGQTKGQNVDAFGAEWYVLSPAGTKVEKTASSPGGYGGGYGG